MCYPVTIVNLEIITPYNVPVVNGLWYFNQHGTDIYIYSRP